MANAFHLYLLGGFRLEKNDAPVKIARQKTKALLAYLALFPGAHTREFLATLFFPDALDADARKNLRVLFAELYKALGKEFFSDARENVELNAEKIWVDAREIFDFRLTIFDWNAHTIEILKSKIEKYSDLLPELYDDWVLQKRDALRERYVELLLQLVEYYRAQSEYAQAVEWAMRVLQTDRANERAHQHLMFLYAASGDRTAALKQFDECVAALDEELGVEPSAETIALAKKIKQQKTGTASEATRLTNLPKPLTSFVGREKEIVELRAMLRRGEASRSAAFAERTMHSPLLTLVGPGGSGKTRLALELGRAVVDEFEHGVWWVELAPLADASLVPQQIAKALGVAEQPNESLTETLVHALRERELLLILDNCEHLLDVCAQLTQSLLAQSLHLSILATSREGLNSAGEQVYPIAPLSVPRANEYSLTQMALEFSAVRLFVERARLAQPQFVLDDANAPFVIQICQRLDGIPLAIELAAARVKQLNVREIAARLDQRFDLLVGSRTALPRQQTLRALMDWSYDLLNDEEKILFRRLSVFAGGWTIASAEEICADEVGAMNSSPLPRAKILDTLLRLFDKSLVTRMDGDETRYAMLETIRAYAREKMVTANEHESRRAKHYVYFTEFAERADASFWSDDENTWVKELEAEHNNLRAALEWSIERGISKAKRGATMRLAGALGHFWSSNGYVLEGEQWLQRALKIDDGTENSTKRARAWSGAGTMAWRRGDFERATTFHQMALELYRQSSDWQGVAFSLNNLGVQSDNAGNTGRAIELYEEGLLLARDKRLDRLATWLLNNLGTLYMDQGNLEQAKQYFEECLHLCDKTRSQTTAAFVLHNLGDVALYANRFESALHLYETSLRAGQALGSAELVAGNYMFVGWTKYAMNLQTEALRDARTALQLFYEIGEKAQLATALDVMAVLLAEQNEIAAAHLFGAAEKLHKELHYPLEQVFAEKIENVRAALVEKIGSEAFERAWQQGFQASLDKVVNFALSEQIPIFVANPVM